MPTRTIVVRPSRAQQEENRLAFNGGADSRGMNRTLAIEPSVTEEDTHPLLMSSAMSRDRGLTSITGDEPESKRQRLVEHEIALAFAEVPRTYGETVASPDTAKWNEAIRSEIRSHISNHMWDIVMRPRGVKVIESCWVFALKVDDNGDIKRYNSRLVARGYLQTRGIDYTQTYAPVAGMNTIRVFSSLCRCR